MTNTIASCNGTEIITHEDELQIVSRSGPDHTLMYVVGLLVFILSANGVAQLFFQPIVAAAMLAITIPLIYAMVAISRSNKQRAEEPATPMLYLANGQLLGADRRVLASLAKVRVRTRFQFGSSSRALALEWPDGDMVIARGNAFGDSVAGCQHVLDEALKRAAA